MYQFPTGYFICLAPSFVLMIIFVLVNLPYYKKVYGDQLTANITRTIILNSTAILIGWAPVTFLWAEISVKFLLPISCLFGAIAVVGSRFIYNDLIPENLVKEILAQIKRQNNTHGEKPD